MVVGRGSSDSSLGREGAVRLVVLVLGRAQERLWKGSEVVALWVVVW